MSRSFAIGDIHGCIRTLEKMVSGELKLQKFDTLYLLGDYIDRGPGSKGIIDFIMNLRKQGYTIHTLRGNHEQMMLEARYDERMWELWLRNGGDSALQSFDVEGLADIPEEYIAFLEQTQYYIETDQFIFAHAGLNFRTKNIFEDKEAMLWIRDFQPYQPVLGNRKLIHGHTPKPIDFILNQQGNCINLDGGCVYDWRPGYGNLVALNLDMMEYVVVKNAEQL